MKFVKVTLGIYLLWLCAALLVGPYLASKTKSPMPAIADRLLGVDGVFAVIALVCLIGGIHCFLERDATNIKPSFWPLISFSVTAILFAIFLIVYMSRGGYAAPYQGMGMLGVPFVISCCGIVIFNRKGR
jgi:hypothetical protein